VVELGMGNGERGLNTPFPSTPVACAIGVSVEKQFPIPQPPIDLTLSRSYSSELSEIGSFPISIRIA